MIDIGRKKDMEMLMQAVNNEHMPLPQRRRAYRTAMSIKRKMTDQTITKLRLRLIAANINDDANEVEKLTDRIRDYERKYHLNRKY